MYISYGIATRSSSLTGSPTARENSRKRIKDTSGHGASPHTTQARPVAKRALGNLGNLGRRLTFSSLGKVSADHMISSQSAYLKVVR